MFTEPLTHALMQFAIDEHIGDRHAMRREIALLGMELVWMILARKQPAALLQLFRAQIFVKAKLFRNGIFLALDNSFKKRRDGIFKVSLIFMLTMGRSLLRFWRFRDHSRQHLQKPVIRLIGYSRIDLRNLWFNIFAFDTNIGILFSDPIEDVFKGRCLATLKSKHFITRLVGLPHLFRPIRPTTC